MSGRPTLDVALVIPVYNERENLPLLLAEIARALREGGGPSYEIVAVDDASTDGSLDMLKGLARDYPELRIVAFAQHAGQTAALAAGFRAARGRAIVTLDADLQNDPAGVPRPLAQPEPTRPGGGLGPGASAARSTGCGTGCSDLSSMRWPCAGCSDAPCATASGRSCRNARRLGAPHRTGARRRAEPTRARRAGAPPRRLPALCG